MHIRFSHTHMRRMINTTQLECTANCFTARTVVKSAAYENISLFTGNTSSANAFSFFLYFCRWRPSPSIHRAVSIIQNRWPARCFSASLTPRDRGVTTAVADVILANSSLEGSSIWYVLAHKPNNVATKRSPPAPVPQFSPFFTIRITNDPVALVDGTKGKKKRRRRGREKEEGEMAGVGRHKKKDRAIFIDARRANESIRERGKDGDSSR